MFSKVLNEAAEGVDIKNFNPFVTECFTEVSSRNNRVKREKQEHYKLPEMGLGARACASVWANVRACTQADTCERY